MPPCLSDFVLHVASSVTWCGLQTWLVFRPRVCQLPNPQQNVCDKILLIKWKTTRYLASFRHKKNLIMTNQPTRKKKFNGSTPEWRCWSDHYCKLLPHSHCFSTEFKVAAFYKLWNLLSSHEYDFSHHDRLAWRLKLNEVRSKKSKMADKPVQDKNEVTEVNGNLSGDQLAIYSGEVSPHKSVSESENEEDLNGPGNRRYSYGK